MSFRVYPIRVHPIFQLKKKHWEWEHWHWQARSRHQAGWRLSSHQSDRSTGCFFSAGAPISSCKDRSPDMRRWIGAFISASFFKIKYTVLWILWSRTYFSRQWKINILWGDLTNISAKKEALAFIKMESFLIVSAGGANATDPDKIGEPIAQPPTMDSSGSDSQCFFFSRNIG